MVNKSRHIVLALIAMMCLTSCANYESNQDSNNEHHKIKHIPEVYMYNDTLSISNITNSSLLTVSVLDYVICKDVNIRNNLKMSIISRINNNIDIEGKWSLSLYATKHNNELPVHIKISDVLDTMVFMHLTPIQKSSNSVVITGNCAPLVSNSNLDLSSDAKKWLFRKNEYMPDSTINNMVGLYNRLNKDEYEVLVTNSKIPTFKSFSGKTYNITSNKKADHYVLYAADSQKDVNDFVEEIVANNFELTVSTLSKPLNCFRNMSTDGIKCIVLISLNNDWSYDITPLGLVAIDNQAPLRDLSKFLEIDKKIDSIIFNDYKVVLPSDKPRICGIIDVMESGFDGNGIKCNVTFKMLWIGDVKSVTIVREYAPGRYRSSYPKPEKKKIMLEDKTVPYLFTYDLHLIDGDNIIPIIAEDYHGNITKFSIVINAEFEYRDVPLINNSIDIYN